MTFDPVTVDGQEHPVHASPAESGALSRGHSGNSLAPGANDPTGESRRDGPSGLSVCVCVCVSVCVTLPHKIFLRTSCLVVWHKIQENLLDNIYISHLIIGS